MTAGDVRELVAQARIQRWEYEAKREPLAVAVAMVLLENDRDALAHQLEQAEQLIHAYAKFDDVLAAFSDARREDYRELKKAQDAHGD